ncbi:Uncharacterised protein [Legionella wadsworthii]|uniref:Opacity protein and related surface antigens n=1 Tax=Legionella wadsworthii TaxID=28088 RepID=A0A378LSF4_9GAMM|nr:hypothetical protein [Legionella wadsworthii]STY29895.1 Uncharacterised protein [Legionella wadsworthii]
MFLNFKKMSCLLFLLGLNSSIAFSAGHHHNKKEKPNPINGYGLVQLGGYWGHQGQAQHINIEGLIGDEFTVTDHTGENYLVGLGYMVNAYHNPNFDLAYGLNAYYLAKTSVHGSVIQEDLFENLSYHYDVDHIPIYIMARAAINTKNPNYGIIIDAGVGPNILTARHFREESLDNQTIPDHIYSRDTITQFSATAGINIKFNRSFFTLPVECGYRFFYLGKGNFNSLSDQVFDSLSTGDSYANALMCGLEI